MPKGGSETKPFKTASFGSYAESTWLKPGVNEKLTLQAFRFNFCTVFNVVTFLPNVVREDRSSLAPGAEAALDQGAVAVESGFLFD